MEDILPIFQEKPNTRPKSSTLGPSELRNFLNEQVRLERLAASTVNKPNSTQIFLEPIPQELFRLFTKSEEMQDTPMTEVQVIENGNLEDTPMTEGNNLNLMPVGNLVPQEEETPSPTTPLLRLNILSYQERRQKIRDNKSIQTPANQESAITAQTSQQAPTQTPPVQATTQTAAHEPTYLPTVPNESPGPTLIDSSSETMHTAPSSPTVPSPPAAIPEATDLATLFNPKMIETTPAAVEGFENIYAYPTSLIPIFSTSDQQREVDTITHSDNARLPLHYSINMDKTLEVLNFVSNRMELNEDDEWKRSGKTMFLKLLLDRLKDSRKVLAIITTHMDEETLLLEWFRDTLRLKCTRFSNLVDAQWEGEHGVMVMTTPTSEQIRFGMKADTVLCFDIRSERHQALIEQIKSIQKPELSAPVAYMVSLGSVEARSFRYLREHNMKYSDKSTDEFKRLFSEKNQWPKDGRSAMYLNQAVANNFSSWLIKLYDTIPAGNYQFRDTIELPQSRYFANLKSSKPLPPQAQDSDDHMDISDEDDEPVTISAVPKTLSPNLTKYIEQVKKNEKTLKKGVMTNE